MFVRQFIILFMARSLPFFFIHFVLDWERLPLHFSLAAGACCAEIPFNVYCMQTTLGCRSSVVIDGR